MDIKGSRAVSVSQSVESLGEVRKHHDSHHPDSQQHDSHQHNIQQHNSHHHNSQQEPDHKMTKSSQSRRCRLVQYSRLLHSRLRGLRMARKAEEGGFNWPGGLRLARRAEGGVYNCKAVEKHFLSSCRNSDSLRHTSYPRTHTQKHSVHDYVGHTTYPKTHTLTHSVHEASGHTSYPRRPTVEGSCSSLMATLQEEV